MNNQLNAEYVEFYKNGILVKIQKRHPILFFDPDPADQNYVVYLAWKTSGNIPRIVTMGNIPIKNGV